MARFGSLGYPPTTRRDLGLQLLSAAQRGNSHEVKRLLAAGVTVNKDKNGLTALHKAAKFGHVSVVKQLLASKKFDVNAQDKYGWTPLHWSSWRGHMSTIHALLTNSKCLVNVLDKSGSNCVHCAAINGHVGVIRVVSPLKCNLNQARKDGWTPLHLASWNGHQDMVHELIVAKVKVNVRTKEGMGSLHLAAYRGHSEIAQELLDAGVAPDMQDKYGNTAMHEAVKGRKKNIVKLLMVSDCRINMRNSQNEMPMDIARKEGYSEIVTEMSGLGYSKCNCHEIKRILFQDRAAIQMCDDMSKLQFNKETETHEPNVLSSFGEKIHKLEEDPFCAQSWEKRLEQARTEVLAKYESRIAQVERQCQDKVARIERQYSLQLEAARSVLGDSFDSTTAPSAVSQSTHTSIDIATSCSSKSGSPVHA